MASHDEAMEGAEAEDKASSQAEYLILLLTDSNLPTGGFVASSGLESYHAHGLLRPGAEGLLYFVRLSLETYTHSSSAVLLGTHDLVTRHVAAMGSPSEPRQERDRDRARELLLQRVEEYDQQYHTLTLNHVAQRASKAQGIALLTLFTKSFAESSDSKGIERSKIISQFKMDIRADRSHGHLPICWAIFAACLDIPARRALQVHLFLQVRAVISSAIRLNIVGPYLAHRLLAFNARDIIDDVLKRVAYSPEVHSNGVAADVKKGGGLTAVKTSPLENWDWSWTETCDAKMTWPLGDLVQARHDQLHSRLFNS